MFVLSWAFPLLAPEPFGQDDLQLRAHTRDGQRSCKLVEMPNGPSIRQQPLVSIVTPSLNAASFIEKTIESVLRQDYPSVEYIVMDGGSSDGTLEILDRYRDRLRYSSEPDAGAADAVNRGFLKTHGSIFAWLSADDVYYPGAISAAVARLSSYPSAGAVYGEAMWIDDQDAPLGRYPSEAPFRKEMLERECCICQPSSFMRREAFAAAGMLDVRLRFAFDYDLWIRMSRSYELAAVQDLLAMSRMHPGNLTLGQRRRALEETIQMLRQHYGYVPLSWIYSYLNFFRNGTDQFFQRMPRSPRIFLSSLWLGTYYNRLHIWRYWREWASNFTLGLKERIFG